MRQNERNAIGKTAMGKQGSRNKQIGMQKSLIIIKMSKFYIKLPE